MKALTRTIVCICSASLLFLGLVLSANAYPALKILHPSLAGGEVIVYDTDMDGLVEFSDVVGGFRVIASIGSSYPLTTDSLYRPNLDLFSIDISQQIMGGPTESLTIMLTDTGFLSDSGSTSNFVSAIGGTTDGSVYARAYLNNSNTADFGMETLINSYNSNDSAQGSRGGFAAGGANSLPTANMYSLTLAATITHSAQFQLTSFDYFVRLTEPGTIALLGLGLIGLGLVRRRLSNT